MPPSPSSPLADLIAANAKNLTKSERRVAQILLQRPKMVAFGTVTDLAQAADSGVATVARLSAKLGFSGFSSLQNAVRQSVANLLEPAAVRIKDKINSTIENNFQLEISNLENTLHNLDQVHLHALIIQLSRLKSAVYVISGNASRGVTQQFVEDLSALRPNVYLVEGNSVQVYRTMSQINENDIVIAIDLRRYDRWLIDALKVAHAHKTHLTIIADSVLSPLSSFTPQILVVAAAGAGPFDSHVGTLALLNVIVAGAAKALQSSASDRLNQAEKAWSQSGALVD